MWEWTRRHINRINWVLFMVMLIMVLTFAVMTKRFADETYYLNNDISTANEYWRQSSMWGYSYVDLPGQITTTDGVAIIMRPVSEGMVRKGGIGFFAINAYVQAYINNELIYTNFNYDNEGRRMDIGDLWHYIELRDYRPEVDEIKLEFTSFARFGNVKIGDIYMGKQQEIFSIALGLDYYKYIVVLLLSMMGLSVLLFRLLYRRTIGLHPSIVMLGFGSLFAAVSVLSISNMVSFEYLSGYILRLIGYDSLLLSVTAVAGYIVQFESLSKRKSLIYLMGISMMWIIFFSWVHLTQNRLIQSWEYAVFFALISGTLMYSLFLLAHAFSKGRAELKVILLSFSQLLGLVMLDFLINFGSGLSGPVFSLLGVVIFFLINAVSEIQTTLKLYEWAELTNYYKYLARTDQMTGLKNRISLVEDLQKYNQNKEGLSIISFDVDNLKMVNDNFGHNLGDDMIISASRLIYDVFGGLGDCYRISGDEFLCISDADIFVINNHLFRFKQAIRSMDHNKPYILRISAGLATFSRDTDKNLQDTMIRADKEMYDDKNSSKDSKNYLR